MATAEKSMAYLIRDGRLVATAETSAKSGEVVSYGFTELDNCIHEVGRAKVSRAKKWERIEQGSSHRDEDGEWWPGVPHALVNYGGGAPI